MFRSFFEMKKVPFSRDVPVSKLYESAAMHECIARLEYAADNQKFIVVTADAGCGKSTVVRKLAASLPRDEYVVMYLSDSNLTPRWFYKGMLDQLGVEARFYRGDSKRLLQHEIEALRGRNKKVICILDEAHLLEKETLEEFRFLLNTEYDSFSPMALALVGQTELWDKLKASRYDAITDRIDQVCTLPHLDRSETEAYISAHLAYAGGRSDIFTDAALDTIYKASGGVERRINRICEKSLMYAAQQNKRLIDDRLVDYVLEHEMPVRRSI